jgi:hypothetical protein
MSSKTRFSENAIEIPAITVAKEAIAIAARNLYLLSSISQVYFKMKYQKSPKNISERSGNPNKNSFIF